MTEPTTPLPLDAPITRANLAQALAELIAGLPQVTMPSLKVGDLASNSGALTLIINEG